mgnify:CR=1 FL=1|jgi:uncharacterized protein YfkK (UPF0435 family)
MDLSQPTQENVRYMIETIAKKLKMATAAAMMPDSFPTERYEDIKDLYDMVTGKDRFSINEMEAIVSELGRLRRG